MVQIGNVGCPKMPEEVAAKAVALNEFCTKLFPFSSFLRFFLGNMVKLLSELVRH